MPVSRLLSEILRASHLRTEARKQRRPLSEVERLAAEAAPVRSLAKAIEGEFSVIAEHKRRSPSGGNMDARSVSRAFEVYAARPWVKAVSVLTDGDYFRGDVEDLQQAREVCGDKPLLRKDFIVEEYQVVEARAFGADAILLMTSLFSEKPERLGQLLGLARALGMEALVELGLGEVAPETLTSMIPNEARIWGINARRFSGGTRFGIRARLSRALYRLGITHKDLLTSLSRHAQLRQLVPSGRLAVAESGIHRGGDLLFARSLGYHAALVGTAFLSGRRSIEQAADELEAALGSADDSAR